MTTSAANNPEQRARVGVPGMLAVRTWCRRGVVVGFGLVIVSLMLLVIDLRWDVFVATGSMGSVAMPTLWLSDGAVRVASSRHAGMRLDFMEQPLEQTPLSVLKGACSGIRRPQAGGVDVPLWMPCAMGLLLVGAGELLPGVLARRCRACPRCGYSLIGLKNESGKQGPAGSVCPECGKAVTLGR